jgi:hypothetical protein
VLSPLQDGTANELGEFRINANGARLFVDECKEDDEYQ